MSSAEISALGEKALLQQRYEARQREEQQQQSHASPHSTNVTGGSTSGASGSGSGLTGVLTPDHTDSSGLILSEDPNRSPTPPPYSSPSSPSQLNLLQPPPSPSQPRGPQKYPGLPLLDYRLYQPPLFELSGDRTTIRSTAPYLSASASALASLIRAQSTVPPRAQLHVIGRRGSGGTHSKIDFAIKLDLMHLLVPEDPRQRLDYIRCVAPGEVALRGGYKPSTEPEVSDEGGLDEWARRFVGDATGGTKTFELERVVANLDVLWLEGQVRSLVASTGYRGVVSVSFPVTHAKVVVQNPDRVNKFFTSVTTLFAGKKKYEVVKAVWPFATCRNGEPGRRCAVQSEETWWKEWRDSIRYAIATKRQGWVTNEDKLEALMEGAGKGVSTVDWGPEY